MKKKIFISLIVLSIASTGYSQELFSSPEDLQNFEQHFYEAPLLPMPTIEQQQTSTDAGMYPGQINGTVKGMPLFKKTRIKIQNYYKEKSYNEAKLLIKKEAEAQAKEEAKDKAEYEKAIGLEKELFEQNENIKTKKVSLKEKLSRKKVKNESELQPGITPLQLPKDKEQKMKSKKGEIQEVETESTKTIELSGGVKQLETTNDATLEADNVQYIDETYDIIATGSPILKFPNQEISLKSDKMIYNRASNMLKAYGNVEVVKDGEVINGDFIQVNMNEESVFMTNIKTKKDHLTVYARDANHAADRLVLNNGKMISEDSFIMKFQSKMIGSNNFNNMMIADDERSSITEEIGDTRVRVKAKEVFINAKKEHDVITLKKAQVFYGEHKLFTIPSITAHTDKSQNYVEGNYPEFGSRANIGMFAGPGFVFDVPNGATLKLLPLLNYKSKIGFGGAVKYRSATNNTEIAYGSANEMFVGRGKQMLDDKLFLQYGANSYTDDWFNGMRMAKYMAEIVYKDNKVIPNSIIEGRNLTFSHRLGAGYMQDFDQNRYGEDFSTSNIGTTRFKYMAQIDQSLYHYANKEQQISVDAGVTMQGSAALYGTGDTQFIGKIGPRVRTQYKHWLQEAGYFMSAYQDGTPMPIYDAYRYGHSYVYLKEAYRVNKYLTLAWSGTFTLTDDSPNNKLFQENSFIIALGPDDLKFNIGYDVVREQTYFAICVAMDTKGSALEYEKMEIKNPDRLAQKNKKDDVKEFHPSDEETDVKSTSAKMKYAEVIDLEDPDKEQI